MGVARKILNWYARLSPARGHVKPPYSHIVQIGDPVLRRKCEKVVPERISSDEVQKTIRKLYEVMNKYGAVGLAAPQIGVGLQIFALQVSKDHIQGLPECLIKSRGLTEIPFKAFINPQLRVLDHRKVIHTEGCESMRGFTADVGRYKAVEISAYNTEGVLEKTAFSDWAARIVQHEMDHLEGKLYTDVMDRSTLSCTCWEEVNLSRGNVELPFYPS